MKAILKENGNGTILREGTLEEVREYLINDLDNLLDWLDEEGNQWEDFIELKNSVKEDIENAENIEALESTFAEINEKMSWWGIYFE